MPIMHGYLSTGGVRVRSNDGAWREALVRVATCGAVGVVAGLMGGQVRLHLGLAGHKALFWMVPVIVARWGFRSPGGGVAGAMGAGLAALAVGGRFAGSAAYLPMAGLAGGVLDVAIGWAERRRLGPLWTVPLVGAAGLAANLVMLAKRMMSPVFEWHRLLGLVGGPARLVSYAAFGLLAGLLGAAIASAAFRPRASARAGAGTAPADQ